MSQPNFIDSRTERKRAGKRDVILEIGARMMNEFGAGAIRLGDIAKDVGMSRNAVYYYVKDRADLMSQCYHRTCDRIEKVISDAAKIEASPTDKIEMIISALLVSSDNEFAIISDAALLPIADQESISERLLTHIRMLADILAQGEAEGQIRARDLNLVAYMILGMVNWAILWNKWSSPDKTENDLRNRQASAIICDIVVNGLANKPGVEFQCKAVAQELVIGMIASREQSLEEPRLREKLKAAASLLFNRHGIETVSIDDIAAAAGVTKGAVYHHFKDKRDLLHSCYDRAFDHYESFAEAAEKAEANSLGRMLTVFYLNCQAQSGPAPPLVLQPGLNALPDRFLVRASLLAGRMRNIHADGIRQKSIRGTDPAIVELTAGAFFWLQKWRGQRSDLAGRDIAELMTAVLLSGIRRQ